jgi:WXG100 family type VII secretion target
MSNDVIRVDYEALAKIADRFGAEAEIVGEVDGRFQSTMYPLHNGGWERAGASAFFAEMDETIFPAVTRLVRRHVGSAARYP